MFWLIRIDADIISYQKITRCKMYRTNLVHSRNIIHGYKWYRLGKKERNKIIDIDKYTVSMMFKYWMYGSEPS